ncbi:hydratase TesE [gamma proteobacterium BDW918]|jgi:2-oxopent-4-enoate/cis-2-oxohex-4-enoate hydratase|uniref:2-oxopent-4-enoate hydratase n=1 Tax=Zhongshania aliphaticivorans TaxID=1470434 RepID=A0A127M9X1_9GAMM|nr:fumarylacetoacetate hydrolase family protein [Zhongshania aliphaticivorans]AMO70044.1 2-oxopent-4-enoate hydratase [Zhongshania aliphaticivorans]EIF41726.1 hydratase TesE [gamma proteobacterium BDW918]|tara:strand:- start:53833 stop:54630 length:798 start_codon:yes stop_codon:yes gene_type:complete
MHCKLGIKRLDSIATELYECLKSATTTPPLSDVYKNIDIEDAYYISKRILDLRIGDGETITGKKIGVTSKVVQDMLGVHQPDFGFLTDAMYCENGVSIELEKRLIQPKAEAEIAFFLKSDLVGPGVTEADVLAATDYIMPCFEIVDSRIDGWRIKIQDTIADNASCGIYILGDSKLDPRDIDLPNLRVSVWKNDEFLSEGIGSAVQGNPLTAVAWLANTLGGFGISLNAGEVILSGSLVPLEPIQAGDKMRMELHGVGRAAVQFV